jgi:tetratricopeptide (TPR) repeat protein
VKPIPTEDGKGDYDMDLLKQCQQWFEQDEAQKVIDTLEAIPAEERTPELDSELAKAYIAVAHIGEREPFEKALELLAPHEEHFAEDHCWNYRIASAYYFLDEEGPALRYFEKALKARPGDKDTQEYIDDCRRRLSLPRFEKNFRERTQEGWAAFSQIEAELRQIIETDETHQRGEELVEKCGNALKTALRDTSFELGFNGEKYELILSPEGLRSRLFPLVYFQKQAPESVLEHWNIWVGRQPCEGFELRAGEIEVRADDVQMWAEETEDHQVSLVLYCEKLTPILKEDTDKVWWALSMLVDQTIGEVSAIAFVAGFDVYAQPKDEPAKLLSELPELLQSMGLSLWRDGSDYLENSYLAYELKPVEDPEADWRLDVYTGSCRLPVLINDYLTARSDMVDEYHKDGIAAGFLLYPLSGFTGEERVKAILDFRDNLRDAILRDAGEEAVTFLGGATGLYCGYLDFIAWDLPAVLTAAQAFFEGSDLPYAHFHAFRRDVGGVPLLDEKEPEPDIHEETGSLLSAEDIETLESFDEGTAAYFGKMLDWLENFIKSGVEEGRFSEKQAHQDLQIALWYAFACLNLDDYIHYYRAAEWMKDSEKNATGCATWYYRYSVALMYCGRLEEALEYAERGALEEPDYPWIWLQAGKLRAHFGDKAGALAAVAHGLALEPGDYEFLTLEKEIKAGAPLEQMEYHWINPDADQTLQQGLDADADDKQRSISCITVNEEGLERFWRIFGPKPEQYTPNAPYTQFPYMVNGRPVDLVFQMNEGGMSKLSTDWLEQLRGWLQSGQWLERDHPDGRAACLDTVLVGLDYRMGLLYKLTEEDAYFQVFLNPDGTEQEGTFWSSEGEHAPELYTEEEMSAIEQHIKNTFGEFENVFHELVSPDIHVDICVVPPSKERSYYTLVTMGMGAHRMNVPEELAEYKLERAELAIALPPDWKLDEESLKDERWYWPIGLLKVLARLPISSDTWLGFGHTMDKQSPFADNTKLCGALLVGPQDIVWNGGEVCTLPSGEEVNFYQVIPLYQEELEYKLEHDADALIEQMAEVSFVVHPDRESSLLE